VQSVCRHTELSWSAIAHQSSGTGFKRRTFSFLYSRIVPAPQQQWLALRSPSTGTSSFCPELYSLELYPITAFCWSWSWSSYCGRQTVDQLVWVSGLPLGPLTIFYLVLLFSADNYLIILSKASSLTRKQVCSLQCNHPLVPITILYRLIWECVRFLSPLTSRRDYGGGILTRLHTG
jgi:hypothetical protein